MVVNMKTSLCPKNVFPTHKIVVSHGKEPFRNRKRNFRNIHSLDKSLYSSLLLKYDRLFLRNMVIAK